MLTLAACTQGSTHSALQDCFPQCLSSQRYSEIPGSADCTPAVQLLTVGVILSQCQGLT